MPTSAKKPKIQTEEETSPVGPALSHVEDPEDPWVFVFWKESNEYSILKSRFVVDKQMLRDSRKTGDVYHGDHLVPTPERGWAKFPARVFALHTKREVLEKNISVILDRFGLTPGVVAEVPPGKELLEPLENSRDLSEQESSDVISPRVIEMLGELIEYKIQQSLQPILQKMDEILETIKEVKNGMNFVATNGEGLRYDSAEAERRKLQDLMPPGTDLQVIEKLSSGNPTDLLRKILTGVFSMDVLRNSSLTGKGPGNKGLDADKISIIQDYMAVMFGWDETKTNTSISEKLKYLKKRDKRAANSLCHSILAMNKTESTNSDESADGGEESTVLSFPEEDDLDGRQTTQAL